MSHLKKKNKGLKMREKSEKEKKDFHEKVKNLTEMINDGTIEERTNIREVVKTFRMPCSVNNVEK